ncbi:MAG: DUF5060 domain-containing protein [Pirellulaceae bacterium]
MPHVRTIVLTIAALLPSGATVDGGEVTRLTLVDAKTNRDVGSLENGAALNRSELGAVNLRADVAGEVASVRFTVDGRVFRTESTAPFALAGDNQGDYNAWNIAPGKHTVKATPFSQSAARGEAGKALEITVTVTGPAGESAPRSARYETAALEPIAPAETVKPGAVEVRGELKKWHKVTLALGGPAASETADPNPFTDYRLNVAFQNGERTYVVPGYYAADGNAAETGAAAGNVWLVHFAPDQIGAWTWRADFRGGKNVAVSDDPQAGEPVAAIDGKSGEFVIAASDKTGRDFRAHGRLDYVGGRYLRFAETGEWFLKCGADAPENFLAYDDFDNTTNNGGRRKSWQAHVRDWREGDPVWRGDRGKGIIGALNYLASEGLNAFSFMPLTIHGDDKNVFPYVTEHGPFTRLDCSKLAQWEIVFEHADHLGLYLHFKTLETENELLLDGGDLGLERRIYYRELIARYAHHLALNWNLGEEINNASTQQKKDWADYFWDHDPYRHHIVIHNGASHFDLLGPGSRITGFSLQTNRPDFAGVHKRTLDYIERSAAAGKPWVVACDEPGDAGHALRPDDDAGDSHIDGRKNGLWGNVMAGGAGLEWYFGYQHAHSDLTCQDYRSRDRWWDVCRHMLTFFNDNKIPYWEMHCDDSAISTADGYCLLKPGDVYVVYLKQGGDTELDLTAARGEFTIQWYDPRNGGKLQTGAVKNLTAGGKARLGPPPGARTDDWVVLVRRTDSRR